MQCMTFLFIFIYISSCRSSLEETTTSERLTSQEFNPKFLLPLFNESVLVYSDANEVNLKKLNAKNMTFFSTNDQKIANAQPFNEQIHSSKKSTFSKPSVPQEIFSNEQPSIDSKPEIVPKETVERQIKDELSMLFPTQLQQLNVSFINKTNSELSNQDTALYRSSFESQSLKPSKEPEILIGTTLSPEVLKITTPKNAHSNIIDNYTCHSTCLSLLDQMTFTMTPNSNLVQKSTSISFECSIPFEFPSALRLLWLFQRNNPPSPQCSLTPQDTISPCSHFPSIEHITDTNLTSKIATEKIILNQLTEVDSGYYYCMVEVFCCPPDPHVMQRTLQTHDPVQIYDENYVLELGTLVGILSFLIVLLVIGTYFKIKRRRRKAQKNFLNIDIVGYEDVLHAPILGAHDDSDSFEESETEDA